MPLASRPPVAILKEFRSRWCCLSKRYPARINPQFARAYCTNANVPPRAVSNTASFPQILSRSMATTQQQAKEKKEYHKVATGLALETVKKRSWEHELKLFGACFWYVSQRINSELRMGIKRLI